MTLTLFWVLPINPKRKVKLPIYEYECGRCSTRFDLVGSMSDYRPTVSSSCCGVDSDRVFTPVNISVFNPYLEHNLGPKPVLIETAAQRDALCQEHGVTYDSTRYVGKPKTKAAVEDVTLGDVKEALNKGKLPDGTKLEIG